MLCCAGALWASGGGACLAAPGAPPAYQYKNNLLFESSEDEEYINIHALHHLLEGNSHMPDEGLLIFSYEDCEVYVLADESANVRCIFMRLLNPVKNTNKNGTRLQSAVNGLCTMLDIPRTPYVMRSQKEDAALLCYDVYSPQEALKLYLVDEKDVNQRRKIFREPRCKAIYGLLWNCGEHEAKLTAGYGYGISFLVNADDLLFEVTLDISQPTVEYAEMRYRSAIKKSLKADPRESAADFFPFFSFNRTKKARVTDGSALRIVAKRDDVCMARDAKFYAFGTEDKLTEIADAGADEKSYGFDKENFSEFAASFPRSFEKEALTTIPEEQPEEETPPADTPAKPTTVKPEVKPAPAVAPKPAPEQPTPAPKPDEPLTPEEARRAFIDLLNRM